MSISIAKMPMMPKIGGIKMQWDNKISTGHLLTMVGMFLAGFFAWADIQASTSKNTADIVLLQQDARQNDTRLRSVEISVASMISTLQSIQVGVSEIKTQVDRLTPLNPRN